MTLRLEQAFYGREERGYGILGASPGCAQLVARVEQLCGSVGTPGRDYGGEPFLFSVPEGERVIMVCGRRGASDSMGRDTLIFHALVAFRKDLDAFHVDAFSLFGNGAFSKRMPEGAVGNVLFDANPGQIPPQRTPSPPLPAFIRSDAPAPDAVRAILGARANVCAWATLAFRPLDGFDLQILPRRVPAPRNTTELDLSGKTIRAAEPERSFSAENTSRGGWGEDAVRSGANGRPDRSGPGRSKSSSSSNGSNWTFKFSLVANLVLALACIFLVVLRKTEAARPAKPADGETAELGRVRSDLETVKKVKDLLETENVDLKTENKILKDENERLNDASISISETERNRLKNEGKEEIKNAFPRCFSETDCKNSLPMWDSHKEKDNHLYHTLYLWTRFFETNNIKQEK